MSTEAFANTGTSLRTARLCMCEWLSLHTLHLQLPTQNCHFVHKMWTPLSTEGIPLFVDALPRLKNTPLPGERKGNREDHPFKPALYPRNSKKNYSFISLQWIWEFPPDSAPREKLLFYTAPAYLQFSFINSFSETAHQNTKALNAALSVCREHLRDILSVMEQSSSCTAVSLWHESCDQEQWEDVWPRTSPPWLLKPWLSWATIMDPLWTSAVAWAAFRAPNSGSRHQKKKIQLLCCSKYALWRGMGWQCSSFM